MAEEKPKTAGRPKKGAAEGEPIVIKKYANRRLYNTGSSTYVTLEDLADLVKAGEDFVVQDAKSGEDITRQVLNQIVFEAENTANGQNLLPIQFLRQLIGLYGQQMQAFVPSYLEMSLDAFSKQQERMREQMAGTFGKTPGYGLFDEQVRQNLALFDRAVKMFTPGASPAGRAAPSEPSTHSPAQSEDELADLKSQVEAMQRQIEKLASKG